MKRLVLGCARVLFERALLCGLLCAVVCGVEGVRTVPPEGGVGVLVGSTAPPEGGVGVLVGRTAVRGTTRFAEAGIGVCVRASALSVAVAVVLLKGMRSLRVMGLRGVSLAGGGAGAACKAAEQRGSQLCGKWGLLAKTFTGSKVRDAETHKQQHKCTAVLSCIHAWCHLLKHSCICSTDMFRSL